MRMLDHAIAFLAASFNVCRCCLATPILAIADGLVPVANALASLAFVIGGPTFAAGECEEHGHDAPPTGPDAPR